MNRRCLGKQHTATPLLNTFSHTSDINVQQERFFVPHVRLKYSLGDTPLHSSYFKMKLCFGSWTGGEESESYQAILAPFVILTSTIPQKLSCVQVAEENPGRAQ